MILKQESRNEKLVATSFFFVGSSVKSFDAIMYMHFIVLYLYKICT